MNDEKRSRPAGGMARARAKRTGRSKSLPISRPIMFALALIVAGAIFLFWPRGESPPAGIGEQFSVVTAENNLGSGGLSGEPRSGDVTIDDEVTPLVPEQTQSTPASGAKTGSSTNGDTAAQTSAKTASPAPREESPAKTTPQTPRSAHTKPAQQEPVVPPLQPTVQGGWAIQLGAFGEEENAARLITKLEQQGYPTSMQTANTSSGEFLFKVWIGYFKTREDAATYARQHRRQIGEAIPVHR